MTELAEIQEKLQATTEAISLLERQIKDGPLRPSLLANMRSLQNRYTALETDFSTIAAQYGVDICSYRIFADGTRLTLNGVAKALINFQSFVAQVYDSLKRGPRRKGHLSEEAVQETSFGLAYTFPGSLGVVLTLQKEAVLFDGKLDEAIQTVFEMTKVDQAVTIKDYSRKLGVAPIRAMYNWANDLAHAESGIDIKWYRDQQVRSSLFIQKQQFTSLRHILLEESEEETEEFTVTGELLGADVQRKSFHIRILREGKKEDIFGNFSDAISPSHTVELPKIYRAVIRKTTRIRYSTEQEDIHNMLLRIESV